MDLQVVKTNKGRHMIRHEVFPGIALEYIRKGKQNIRTKSTSAKDMYEIIHCREGRIEFDNKKDFYYLSEGDILIRKKSYDAEQVFFTQDFYRGLSVEIDVEKTPSCFSCFLEDVNVNPQMVIEKFCGKKDYFIARSGSNLEHVFYEMYDVPENIKTGYIKVKILELMLYLSTADVTCENEAKHSYSREQVALAKEVSGYMISNMSSRITLDDLTKKFHVSGTQLKTTFKGVYGVSIYSYIRKQKMQSAAQMLRNCDDTVLEIAGRYGYENGSKFAKAFKETIGLSPNAYRQSMRG